MTRDRVRYLEQHFQEARRALADGVPCTATSSGRCWITSNGRTGIFRASDRARGL